METYTLFYCPADGKLHKGTCHEVKEVLENIEIGEPVAMEGYRGEKDRLVLTGLTCETTAEIALVVPENTTIFLESGVSRLTVHARGEKADLEKNQGANVAVVYVKGNLVIDGDAGTLVMDAADTTADTCLWSRALCVRYGDLTVRGGNLEAYAGACAVRAGALYAGGRLYGGDAQAGAITITGGSVTASAYPHTIRATSTKLTIGPCSIVENSGEFAGSREEWHGDYLAQKDRSRPVLIRFENRSSGAVCGS